LDFEYTATYFAMQKPHRLLVAEEGKDMTFEVGAVLGGKYVNTVDESVYFEIDPSLLDSDTIGMELLPSDYYTLSDNERIVIPAGEFLGTITVTLNENFLNDSAAATLHYVLPFRITDATTDSILSEKATSLVAVQFANQYYGAYWITGTDYLVNYFGTPYDSIVYSDPDLVRNNYRIFQTVDRNRSMIDYCGVDLSGNNILRFAIAEDDSVTISADTTNTFIELSGKGKYHREERIFTLDYRYRNPDDFSRHWVLDTLIYFDTPMEVMEW
jgi:hypothetical protein